MEQVDRIKVTSLGGSLFVRLPSRVCKLIQIEKGTSMEVYRDGNAITFKKEEQCKDST